MLQKNCRYKFQIMRITLFGFFLFLGMNAIAQSLDLDGYLALLQERSIVLQQSANHTTASRQDVRTARAALLPAAEIDLNYQRDFTKNFLFLNEEDPTGFFPDKFRTNFNNTVNASAIVEQSVFDPVALANYRLAKLAAELAQLSNADLSKDLVNQGAQLFWQAIFARESLKVLEENKVLADEQWQQMRDLFEEGYASELQVRQSESFFKRTIPQLQSAQNAYGIMLNEMRALASLPTGYPLELEAEIILSDDDLNNVYIKDTSLIQNTQMRLLFRQAQIAERQIGAAKAARYPAITARLGYHFNAQDNAFKFDNSNKLIFGQLGVQIPIFTGGFNSAQIQKAKIERENVLLEIQNKSLQLRKDLSNAALNLQTALEKIGEEKEAIQLSEKELEIAAESQKLGMVTPLEIREMRLGLTGAKLRLLNAFLDLRVARLQMNRILGKN